MDNSPEEKRDHGTMKGKRRIPPEAIFDADYRLILYDRKWKKRYISISVEKRQKPPAPRPVICTVYLDDNLFIQGGKPPEYNKELHNISKRHGNILWHRKRKKRSTKAYWQRASLDWGVQIL